MWNFGGGVLLAMRRERFHEAALDHVERCLMEWAVWMRAKVDLAAPHEALGFVGGGYSQDFEDELAKVERRVARDVDASIEDLGREAPAQRLAIYITYGIAEGNVAVWRFREPVEAIYERAKTNLVPRFKRRGIWLGE
jgi:hypothetical protein